MLPWAPESTPGIVAGICQFRPCALRSQASRIAPGSTGLRQIEIELCQRGGVFGSFRCIQDFDTDNAALIVVIDDDTVRDPRCP
jgi:hypothetical protein